MTVKKTELCDFVKKRARPEILSMKEYSSARSLYKSKTGMIFLDANECSYEPYIGASSLSRYPEQQPAPLVDALCRLYDISSRNLAITRGADEAIDILLRAFCVPGKDNIILCPPTFAMYEQAALIQGADVKKIPLKGDFSLDKNAIEDGADKNTKIIFICSPNNPTGNLADIKDIRDICATFKDRALVVVDETYAEFSGRDSGLAADIEQYGNLVVLRTLSKSYAAAGLRCGCAIAARDVAQLMLKVLPPYPIPTPVTKEALNILQLKNLTRLQNLRTETVKRRDEFIEEINNHPDILKIYTSSANFLLIKTNDADAFIKKCLKHNVVVRNQSHNAGLENCVRIAIGSGVEMRTLIAAINGEPSEILPQRTATITRKTAETSIECAVNLDKADPVKINTGLPFYDHMLEQLAKHGGFSIMLECEGDLAVEAHHAVEDCAIALGQAIKSALGNKRGIARYGSHEVMLPMDEALARVALDLSGRYYLDFKADFPDRYVGNVENPLPIDMVEHVFRSMAENLQATLHINVTGKNTHHMVEACFKGFARALSQALCQPESKNPQIPSTKGAL